VILARIDARSPEAGRQITYGALIVAMLLFYGRERLQR
jgi:hypothetical protein